MQLEHLRDTVNFLAHALLAGRDAHSIVGNLMADFLHGRPDPSLPPGVIAGILMHRKVDAFTDGHAVFLRTRTRLRPRWGRYSPILVDIFYDHILASEWEEHGEEPLREFADFVYGVLQSHADVMPGSMRLAMARMIEHDWFGSYATEEGIAVALERLSRRFLPRREVHLERAVEDLREMRGEIAGDFREFFPELREYVEGLRRGGGGEIRQ